MYAASITQPQGLVLKADLALHRFACAGTGVVDKKNCMHGMYMYNTHQLGIFGGSKLYC